MKKASLLALAVIIAACSNESTADKLNRQASEEYLQPIRPASDGRNPCWNEFSVKFIYAPAFDPEVIEGADSYRYTVVQKSHGEGSWSFADKAPTADLSPIWNQIPPSNVELTITALDKDGKELGTVLQRKFLRDFPFEGPYHSNVRPYREAAMLAALYIHHSKAVQAWKTQQIPAMDLYSHYTYASKIVGGLITIECNIAKCIPSMKEEAVLIAKNAAQFLFDQSRPEGEALEFLPPTYYMDLVASGRKENIGKTMTMDALMAGNAFLDLYDVTGDELYLDRAVRMARTYSKIQREDGSFPIKMDFMTGEPVNGVGAMLHPILNYVTRLEKKYGIKEFEDMKNKAWKWMNEVALETFDLTGQFEDVTVQGLKHYQNLTNCTAAPFASFILKNNPDKKGIKDAIDLIRMSEDQFVHWNDFPNPHGVRINPTPCVYEQHKYQMPVDASSCNMANAYLDLYAVTGDCLAYSKAKALVDNLTIVQDHHDGHIPTTMRLCSPEGTLHKSFWYNCTSACVTTLLRMAELEGE